MKAIEMPFLGITEGVVHIPIVAAGSASERG
jgi:hypothetical protein